MSKAVHIHVPKPCHENWQSMSPKEQGRFCGSCQKIVVDFSKMNDREMLHTISNAAGQSVCGRFANDQLNRRIEPAINKRRFSVPYVWNLLLAGMLFFEACNDATTGEIEVTEPRVEKVENETLGKVAVDDSTACSQPGERAQSDSLKQEVSAPNIITRPLTQDEATTGMVLIVEDDKGKENCKKEK